jgi:hypothetical protein
MKIYLAGSWRYAETIREYLKYFRKQERFEVDCFCDQEGGRIGFNIRECLERWGDDVRNVDAITALEHPAVADKFHIAFAEDKKWLDWCECVVMMMPCGKSAHLEAGYVKGQGKLLFIYWMADLVKGEFDNMYQFADGMFRNDNLYGLIETIKSYDNEYKRG